MTDEIHPVSKLILHGLVVTMDDALTVIPDGGLAIDGPRIVAVGAASDLTARYRADDMLDASGQLVMPGLINAHTHAAASIFRGLCEDMELEPWLQKSWRFETKFVNPQNVRIGAQLAQAEMIRSGTTTALDMYWMPEIGAEVAEQVGFRLMTGPIYLGIPNAPDGVPENERTARGREFLQQYRHHPLIVSCVQPHSTYTVPDWLLKQAGALAQEFGVFFNMHCSETAVEVKTVSDRTGMSPPRYLDQLGLLSPHTVLAHCIHVPPDEIQLFAQRGITVAHCPVSNLKLAAGLAPVVPMRRAGVKVLLGTDSAQSSNDLDLWLDMRFAAILHKNANGDPTLMPAADVVKMVTRDAARALGLADRVGSLEPGKCADVILLDLKAPHTQPLYDIYAQLVYALGREDVSTVLINGRVVLRDRRLQTLDEQALMSQMDELAARIRAELYG